MVGHDDPWQVFAENGELLVGKSAHKDDFKTDKNLIMGAAHVWIWRRREGIVEVLVQHRAVDKRTWPDYWDISAAGHIDAGETALQAAVRETREEIGIAIDANRLRFIFSIRTPLDTSEFDIVYLYELVGDARFSFDDGEVQQLAWHSLSAFEDMTHDPQKHKLVPQGDAYFKLLVDSIRVVLV